MVVSTSLYDTSDDGYSVKLQGKIDGYGYTLLGNGQVDELTGFGQQSRLQVRPCAVGQGRTLP